MTIDLKKSFFIHCFLVVQDHYGFNFPQDIIDTADDWLHDYDVHIGDSSDYTENPKCTGSPFMKFTDPDSFTDGEYSAYMPSGPASMWKYGKETWCNK